LVTAPGEGLGGWFGRLFTQFGRHWRAMYLIGLATFAVPTVVLDLVLPYVEPRITYTVDANGGQVPHLHLAHPLGLLATVLLAVVALGYLGAVAQAAFVWTITRRAVDAPAALGGALRYGLRTSGRLWGWSLVYGALLGVGLIFCVLPGLYLAFAGCLYPAIVCYQRGLNPISTSFSMIHKNFGPALGRVVLATLLAAGANLVLAVVGGLAGGVGGAGAVRVVSVVTSLVTIPLSFVAVLVSVLLFAELRARLYPLRSLDLDAVL
jgi:hypothetical protein